jgi:AcrR family transcriptional regulator
MTAQAPPDAPPARRVGRKAQLVEVAARLFAARGYHNVGINDIGAELGLTGPALYRHFPSKEALLVAVFDEVISENLEGIRRVVASTGNPRETLEEMIRHHVTFVAAQSENLTTWRQEFRNLPPDDGSRLRRMQRQYMEEWVHVLSELLPDLDDAQSRALAHAVIGLLQSPTEYRSGLAPDELAELLFRLALAVVDAAGPSRPAARTTSRARTPRRATRPPPRSKG